MDTPGQEETSKRDFAKEGLCLNFVSGSRYLGAYLGPQAELEAWIKPQVEAWAHEVRSFAKINPTAPPVGLLQLGNVFTIGVAVPIKDCPQSRHSDGPY